MEKLKKHIHDDGNGLDYVLVGDYYIPDLQLQRKAVPLVFGDGCTKPIWSYTIQPAMLI